MDNLKSLPEKTSFDSSWDDVLKDFYIPALSCSKRYYRVAGYFSSTSIAVAAKGVRNLLKNGGTMKMVVGLEITKEDQDVIKQGNISEEDIVSEKIQSELDKFNEEDFSLQRLRVFSWMLKRNLLEIKFAALNDSRGIYHPKIGILEDDDGNAISFHGSNNETSSGWSHNVETFHVFRKWGGDKNHYEDDVVYFNRYWNDESPKVKVYSMTEAVREKILEYAPDDPYNENVGYDDGVKEEEEEPVEQTKELRREQMIAIMKWAQDDTLFTDEQLRSDTSLEPVCGWREQEEDWDEENRPYQGILAMATGTGKTFTAVRAAMLAEEGIITLIAMKELLMVQWEKTIRELIPSAQIIFGGGGRRSNWKNVLPNMAAKIRMGGGDSGRRVFVLCTYNLINNKDFLGMFSGIEDKLQVIGDEVHNFGSRTRRTIFNIKPYRVMGLSATHTRFDEEETASLERFFGHVSYEYTIAEAIEDGRLCHYEYFPHFVSMTENEATEYRDISGKKFRIERVLEKPNIPPADAARLSRRIENLNFQMSAIIKKATGKPDCCRNVINKEFPDDGQSIIFCEDHEQETEIKNVLNNMTPSRRYTTYHSNLTEYQKQESRSSFERGDTPILLGINCLDEGLDVPDAGKCLIISSTTTARQFVQRRGRILRKPTPDSNKIARMHDIVVTPIAIDVSNPPTEKEQNDIRFWAIVMNKEIRRINSLIDSADNREQVTNTLRETRRELGLLNELEEL